MSITVVGGGVSGLTTAHVLLDRGHRVTVVAAEWHPHIVSSVAAAVWYPYKVEHPEVSRWGRRTFERFRQIASDPATGVKMVEGIEYRFAPEEVSPPWVEAVEDFEIISNENLPSPYKSAFRFRVPIIETPTYMAWLYDQISRRATLQTRQLGSLYELLGTADAIINCSGLGARELVDDASLYPIRGQIVKLAPGVLEEFVLVQESDADSQVTYIIPREDGTICGGTAQPDEWALTPDQTTSEMILARATQLRPVLDPLPPLETLVGLRPARPTIRLDVEMIESTPVIHNYGHGGAGFTLSWGCAEAVATLLEPNRR